MEDNRSTSLMSSANPLGNFIMNPLEQSGPRQGNAAIRRIVVGDALQNLSGSSEDVTIWDGCLNVEDLFQLAQKRGANVEAPTSGSLKVITAEGSELYFKTIGKGEANRGKEMQSPGGFSTLEGLPHSVTPSTNASAPASGIGSPAVAEASSSRFWMTDWSPQKTLDLPTVRAPLSFESVGTEFEGIPAEEAYAKAKITDASLESNVDISSEKFAALKMREKWPPGSKSDRATMYQKLTSFTKAVPSPAQADLFLWAATDDANSLKQALLNAPTSVGCYDVDETNGLGQTPLHLAVWFGALDAAAVLLTAGWDPSAADAKGRRPLDLCCRGGFYGKVAQQDREETEIQCYAMVALLLLFGATAPGGLRPAELGPASGTSQPWPIVGFVVDTWDRVQIPELGSTWEPPEASFLGDWFPLSTAIADLASLADVRQRSTNFRKVSISCALLGLALETQISYRVLPTPADQSDSSSSSSALPHAPVAKLMREAVGSYSFAGFRNGFPSFVREDNQPQSSPDDEQREFRIVWQQSRWTIVDGTRQIAASDPCEGPVRGSCWPNLSIEGRTLQYRTFGSKSAFPPIRGRIPRAAPFLGLWNPKSGCRAGEKILRLARRWPLYRIRFFDILDVATNENAKIAFLRSLEGVKMESIAYKCRPRLLFGGGDGTASFTIWCIFRTLRVEEPSVNTWLASEQQFWLWNEEDLQLYFPALVHIPLGTGNDLAGSFGWGRKFGTSNKKQLYRRFLECTSQSRPIVPFDVWGLHGLADSGLKVAEYAGPDPNHLDRSRFKLAGPSVPFISLLYTTFGYEAFVAAQVELQRSPSRFKNLVEYAKAIPEALIGPQRRNIDLTGIRAFVPHDRNPASKKTYFPPPGRGTQGSEYSSLGFFNINSYAGGVWTANDSALTDDGKLDMFRQKNFLANVLRRGRTYLTEKHAHAWFSIPGDLPGVHFQVDGEARLLFSPQSKTSTFKVPRVMQVPVVVGPESKMKAHPQQSLLYKWNVFQNFAFAQRPTVEMPFESIAACKAHCIEKHYYGFCIADGISLFQDEIGHDSQSKWCSREGSTIYIVNIETQSAGKEFFFTLRGDELTKYHSVLYDWAGGQYGEQVRANADEVDLLQKRSDKYASGICARSTRIFCNLRGAAKQHGDGSFISFTTCSICNAGCKLWGCKGCRRPFCQRCFSKHRGSAPSIYWSYDDSSPVTQALNLHQSNELCLKDAIDELSRATGSSSTRPVKLTIRYGGKVPETKIFKTTLEAVRWIQHVKEHDEISHGGRMTLERVS